MKAAACADDDRCGEEDGADQAVEEENGESDGEGGARMIAWGGGVVGADAPDMGGRVRGEGAVEMPDLADRLS